MHELSWRWEVLLALRVLAAAILGGIVGWQREHVGRAAGVRTFAAVSLGSCLFGLMSTMSGPSEGGRIAAQVVTGIGFLCAGVILRDQGRIIGLTTAATLWATAAVGLAIAYGWFLLAVLVTILLFILLAVPTKRWERHPTGIPPTAPDDRKLSPASRE
jgi:putative Mg2+ transporter-C (MgtC) family protein